MTDRNASAAEVAAEGQAFFATMAQLRGDTAAAKAHWDLALNYQRDHIKRRAGA